MGFLANIGNDLFPLIQGHAANLFLCFDRSIDCLIHVLKHSMHTGHTSGNLHIRHDLLYDVMYHAFIYRHFITSFNADAP